MANFTQQTQTDHVAFVNSLQLAEPRYALPPEFHNRVHPRIPPDNKKEGYVVAGGLTAFTAKVSGQAKRDILNATLLAQLASDRKYHRERDVLEWYQYYNHILRNIGFTIRDFQFRMYESSGPTIKIDEVVTDILAEIDTAGESAVVMQTLAALRKLSDNDEKIKLFDKHGSHSTLGNFQVYSCDEAPNGEVSLSLGAIYFKSDQKDDNFMFYSWKSANTRIYTEAQNAVLDSDVYAEVRSTVSAKLGDNVLDLVAHIDI